MALDPGLELELTVAALQFDVTIAEVSKIAERLHSIMGFCSEDEKAEQSWDRLMEQVNQHHHELLLENILQPLKV